MKYNFDSYLFWCAINKLKSNKYINLIKYKKYLEEWQNH